VKRPLVTILLFAMGALLLLPAYAAADDAGLFAAYDGQQKGALAKAGRSYAHHARRWKTTGGARKWSKAVIRDDRHINAALDDIATAVRAQQPSSANGKRAKSFALKEMSAWKRANRKEMHGLRLWLHGHRHRARAAFKRAGRMMFRKTYPYGKRAVKAFAAAGFKSKNGAVSE
jgi:hypothetical protein